MGASEFWLDEARAARDRAEGAVLFLERALKEAQSELEEAEARLRELEER